MGKTHILTLTKKWFDMIKSGEKTEEYREPKPYWHKRLSKFKQGDTIIFRNGYSKDSPTIQRTIASPLYIGRGKAEWGAPSRELVYIIKLTA